MSTENLSQSSSVDPDISDIVYEENSGFWIRNSSGIYVPLSERGLKRELWARKFRKNRQEGEAMAPVDKAIHWVEKVNSVVYAGSLAGYSAGIREMYGRRILITTSPRLIKPVAGGWDTIYKLLFNMLTDGSLDQRPYFYGWAKIMLQALFAQQPRPGQALCLVGEAGAGKSLLQNLITELFGGRASSPYRYMTGRTTFNGDLFQAEHLVIEDEAASTDLRSRRIFGANLKNFTVNKMQSMHAKYKTPIEVAPLIRLSVTVNNEPEYLRVLPVLDESILDKIMLLKVKKSVMPMPTMSLEQRELFWNTLVCELPAFGFFLLNWEIPKGFESERFGITHFHHPEVVVALSNLEPETRLLDLIDMEIFKCGKTTPWTGAASKLEEALYDTDNKWVATNARAILNYNTACGYLLSKLKSRCPERISEREVKGLREWTIKAQEMLDER